MPTDTPVQQTYAALGTSGPLYGRPGRECNLDILNHVASARRTGYSPDPMAIIDSQVHVYEANTPETALAHCPELARSRHR